MNKTTTFIVAILAGFVSGYFLKDNTPEKSSSTVSESASPRRDVRLMVHPAIAKTLSLESQERLRELELLASADPRKALTRLPAFRDTDLLPLALTAIAKGWALTDPQAAAQWAAGLESSEDQVSAVLGLVPVWTDRNPEDCLEWASSRPEGNMREVSLVEIADAWVSHSPETALARFLSMKPEQGTERGLHVITSQWALDDPQAAIATLSAMDPTMRRDEFLETALVSLTNQDPELTWKQSTLFNDAKRIEHVRAMALEAIAETRPQDALKLASTVGSSPVLLESIARSWASWDEPAAQAWIASLKDAELAESLNAAIHQ